MTEAPNTPLNDPPSSQLSEATAKKRKLRRPSRAFSISALSGICIMILVSIAYLSTLQPILAQGNNPTEALIKTLSSGIQQQFTLTAQAVMPLTVTALNLPTYTPSVTPNATQQRQTLGAIVNNQLTLTSTAVYQLTVNARINELATSTAQSLNSMTPSPTLNQTEAQQTLDVIAGGRLPQVATDIAQTAISNRVYEFLTATAVSQPTLTPAPLSPEQQQQTLAPIVSLNLTLTAQAQATQNSNAIVQATVLAINAPFMTATAQSLNGNSLAQKQTLDAYIGDRMTQTAQYVQLQTSVANIRPTSESLLRQRSTATAQAVKANLATGLQAITPANVATISQLNTLSGHTGTIRGIAINPLGTVLASASDDGTIRLWDIQAHTPTLVLKGVSDRQTVAFSPDGQRIVAGSSDGTVRVWDVNTGAEILTLRGHRAGITSVAFSLDGTRMASASVDRTVIIWDASNGSKMLTLPGHLDAVTSLAFSPDGLRLVSGGNDSTIRLWEVTTGFLLATYYDSSPIKSVAVSPDGNFIASANQNGAIHIHTFTNEASQGTMKGRAGGVIMLAFSADGKLIACTDADGNIIVWDASAQTQVATLTAKAGPVTAIGFSPDGARLISASADNTLTIWGIPGGQ